jgi:hypothetical protein
MTARTAHDLFLLDERVPLLVGKTGIPIYLI